MALAVVLALTGCSKQAPDGGSRQEASDVAEPSAAKGGAGEAIKASMPQIAYVYRYAFEIPAEEIPTVIGRHIATCDRMGPARCRVLDMRSATSDGTSTGGSLKLIVEAGQARSFGASLAKVVTAGGGKQSDSSIEAEDLSKQIVDTEARLRSKQALAERLMGLLNNRNGPVADLVAAERSVASVQEEIDAAQSWLAEARGRVSMSTVEISYGADGAVGAGFWAPLKSSFRDMSGFFGQSLSLLIMLIAALLPWIVVAGGIFFGVRWLRPRFRKGRD
ncbi:MAG: DUF4349 domain-containing protein [Pseudomonadota bacterium]